MDYNKSEIEAAEKWRDENADQSLTWDLVECAFLAGIAYQKSRAEKLRELVDAAEQMGNAFDTFFRASETRGTLIDPNIIALGFANKKWSHFKDLVIAYRKETK